MARSQQFHLIRSGDTKALCGIVITETVHITLEPGEVNCGNCWRRIKSCPGNPWVPTIRKAPTSAVARKRGPKRGSRMSPPPVTVDDVEASIWRLLAELGLRPSPVIVTEVERVLTVAREWALCCGAVESQLGMESPAWDESDGVQVPKKKRGRRTGVRPGMMPDTGRDTPSWHRECRSCRRWLPIGHFHKDSGRPDGYRSQCRDCVSQRVRRRKDELLAS